MGKYRIVSDIEKNYEKTDIIKASFIKRDFVRLKEEIEKNIIEDNEKDIKYKNINRALANHILGNYDVASGLYEKILNDELSYVNYMAYCHRYFDYGKVCENNRGKEFAKYKIAYENNLLNFFISTMGIDIFRGEKIPLSIFSEQIVNDLYIKLGKKMLHKHHDDLKAEFLRTVEIIEEKQVYHEKKVIGIFVTDIQRHKDAALIFELIECFKDEFEVIVYFYNIFTNKLTKTFDGRCRVRYVINMYYEEINNLLYDDEIDLLIDFAELGLRNNNISISLVSNCVSIHQLLKSYPIILQTKEYFNEWKIGEKNDYTCVIGDFRCLSDRELVYILNNFKGDIIFESQSLDEKIFKINFGKKLVELGYDMSRVQLLEGVRPFNRYMELISSCNNIIISSGASYVELSEAIRSDSNICLLSNNELIMNLYEIYSKVDNKVGVNEDHKYKLCQYIRNYKKNVLYKVKNKKSRIAYVDDAGELCINNTCNGDIIIFGERENENSTGIK